MNRARNEILLALIIPLMLSGCVSHPGAQGPTAETYTTTANVNGEQRTQFHATSREFRFDSKSFYPPAAAEALGLRIVRYEIAVRTTWYLGMDGLESRLEVTACLVDEEGKPQRTLWTIDRAGHEFSQSHIGDSNVYIIQRGCCDSPDTLSVFDGWSGKFKEALALPRDVANDISGPNKGLSQ